MNLFVGGARSGPACRAVSRRSQPGRRQPAFPDLRRLLLATGYQDTIASTTIHTNTATPADGELAQVIQQAHSRGLQVMLKPYLDLWADPGHWRGEIGTAFSTPGQWAAWFASYQQFIWHYAELAEANGADQLAIGTELLGTSQREADWRAVVAGVRSRYGGPIVYAANHSGEETSIASGGS